MRILRVARFAARFGFHVADETIALMRRMVPAGEADYLVPERVWQELARGLAEPHPERMFEVLEACGLAEKLLDGVRPVVPLLASAAKANASVPVRFARHRMAAPGARSQAVCERLKAPNDVRELALLACRNRVALRAAPLATPAALLELLKRTDAIPAAGALRAASGGCSTRNARSSIRRRIRSALAAAAAVDAGAIAAKAPRRATSRA